MTKPVRLCKYCVYRSRSVYENMAYCPIARHDVWILSIACEDGTMMDEIW